MLKHLKLQSRFLLLLLCNLILIAPAYSDAIETHLSGFATTTMYSDPNWFENTGNLAINFDITHDDWAIRGQVATGYENKIRRLAIEKSIAIKPKHEMLVQVGRSPRLTSFYNSINDSPGTTGMAILPLGGFSHRMVENSTFNSIDGIKSIYTIKTDKGIITLSGDYGILPLEDQCGVQQEAAFTKCRAGYEFKSVNGAFDLGLSYETGPWTVHGYFGSTRLNTELLDKTDRTSNYITSNYSKIHFDVLMTGVKYSENKWLLQSEVFISAYKTAKINQPFVTVGALSSFYLLAGYNWTDQFSTYTTFSRSLNNGAVSNMGRSIGATYVMDNTTVSLDYHNGTGYGWQKFFSPVPGWNSFVLSITQRF